MVRMSSMICRQVHGAPLMVFVSYSHPTSILWHSADRTCETIAAAANEVPPICASNSSAADFICRNTCTGRTLEVAVGMSQAAGWLVSMLRT